MSAPTQSRLLIRQSRFFARQTTRRNASTTEAASNVASKSKEVTSNVTSKASEGLSKVTSSAGPALSGAAKGVGNALGRIGGRTGRLISFVESLIPPTVYYSRVGLELSKLVFKGQRMTPPDAAAFSQYFNSLSHAFRNPSTIFQRVSSGTGATSPEGILSRIRSASPQQLATVGVIGLETLGFFTVGEMIGRFKVVGYRGDPHATSH